MSSVPALTITIADGEITVDAELLAPKLGLSAEALKAEMRKGNVESVAETGIDEDAGRTRVTFRYRTRAWTGVVDADGTCKSVRPRQDRVMTATAWELAVTMTVEDSTPETLARQLQARATQRLPITYQEAVTGLLHVTATAWGLAATTAVENDAPETLARQRRAYLQARATQRLPITYPGATKGLPLTPPNTVHQVIDALEQLMADPKPKIT